MRSQLLLEQAQLQARRAQQRLQRSGTAATPGGIAATPGAWLALGACMETPAGGSGGCGGSGGSGGNGGSGSGSSGGDDATVTLTPASGHPTTPGMPQRYDAALYDSSASANGSAIGGDVTCETTGELNSGTPTAALSLVPSHHGSNGGRGGGSNSSSSPPPDNSNAPGSVTPGSASSGSTDPTSPDVQGLQRAPSALTPSVVEMQRELQTVQRELQELHRKREKRKTR